MHDDANRYLYSLITRISKMGRRQTAGDDDLAGDMACFSLLFQPPADGLTSARVRMTDVSHFLMVSKPAATQAVNRLVQRGLVERTSDPNDRRVVYIQATPAGHQLFQRKLNERLKYIEAAIARVGEDKAIQLGALLDEFVDALVAVTEEN